MRYENWDVLLFLGGARAPVQEFKTECYVVMDTDSPYLKYNSTFSPSTFCPHGNFGQLPVLTSFIPTAEKDTPFRVSIHNWDKPQPSRLVESLMQPDDLLLYEARVFLDGQCVAAGIFSQHTTWPYVIDYSSQIDREGNQDLLRFPLFHPDILEQQSWDAGDTYGRIKIILSEGFSRPHRSPPFERVKDVVGFSFQHAPLNILEFSSISWPNPNMWMRLQHSTLKYNTQFSDKESEPHGHTPSKDYRSQVSNDSRALQPILGQVTRAPPPVPSAYAWPPPPRTTVTTFWSPPVHETHWDLGQENDFMSQAVWQQRGARSSRDDFPMLDYSSSNSRAMSSIDGMSFEHSKQPSIIAMDDEQYDRILQTLTPTKAPVGTRAPSNTPSVAVSLSVVKGKKEAEKEKEKEKVMEKVIEKVMEKEEKQEKEQEKEMEKENDLETPKKVTV